MYIDSESDNKQSKKKQKEKLSIAKTVYKRKKIDVEIQKRQHERKKLLVEKTENVANCCHELVMVEAKERRIELQTQAVIG